MSTILPLEVVFGKSVWSLVDTVDQPVDPNDIRFYLERSVIELEAQNEVEIIDSIPENGHQVTWLNPSAVSLVPHAEGLGSIVDDGDWNKVLEAVYILLRPNLNRNRYLEFHEDLLHRNIWNIGGEFGPEYWGSDISPGYGIPIFTSYEDADGNVINIKPYYEGEGLVLPWEEEILVGECGSGSGSERPDYGLLYPRKV